MIKLKVEINPLRYSREEPRPTEGLLPDDNEEALVASKALSLTSNFSFVDRMSLLLISNSYTIVLTRLYGPRSRPYTSRKFSKIWPGIEPETSWLVVRRANHYAKEMVMVALNFFIWL